MSEGCEQMMGMISLITARIRRMGEANVFTSVCLSDHTCRGAGTPFHGPDRWAPIPGLAGGYSIPGLDGRVPHPRSGWGYPGVPLSRSGPRSGQGCTLARTGWCTPIQDWIGYPLSRTGWGTPAELDGVPPWPGLDVVTPPGQNWMGYPTPTRAKWGTPLIQNWTGYPPSHS